MSFSSGSYFYATCNAISYIGAHPVFLDVDRDTLGLSPLAVKRWLSGHAEVRNGQCYNKKTGRRIKACVPMHTFGHPEGGRIVGSVQRKNFLISCIVERPSISRDSNIH